MIIIYHDEVGIIAREIDNEYGISFNDNKVYFSSNDIDYIINVSDVVQIEEGNFEN